MTLLSLALGCSLAHRTQLVLAPPSTLSEPPSGELAEVTLVHRTGATAPYAPERVGELARPELVTRKHQIVVDPNTALSAHYYVRNFGVVQRDAFEIHTVTGAHPESVSQEVRQLPATLDTPLTLDMRDLTNTWNGYRIADDDLFTLELSDGARTDRYVFQKRRVGLAARGSYGLLVRSPMPTDDQDLELTPALTGGLAVGWRRAERGEAATRILDNVELIASVGLGTETIAALQEDGAVTEKVDVVRATGLGGGGLVLFRSISAQVLTPLSVDPEPSLAIGIDTVELTVLTRDLARRLLRDNELGTTGTD